MRSARPRSESSLGDRPRYLFDNCMTRGTTALIGWLTAVTLRADRGLRGDHHVFRPAHRPTPPAAASPRSCSTRSCTPSTPATSAGTSAAGASCSTMLVLTIGGLFIISALIGVIAAGIDEKLAELRRGRSIVLERDHTVILGWSDSIFTIVSELTLANESRKPPGRRRPRRPRQGRDGGRAQGQGHRTAAAPGCICRSGSPIDLDDLALSAAHQRARSVILLAPDSPRTPTPRSSRPCSR